jgi:PKD repeat protein
MDWRALIDYIAEKFLMVWREIRRSITPPAPEANLAPVAGFTFTANLLVVQFIDTSTDEDGTVTTWAWDFGDTGTSALQSPSHTYAAIGTYTVTLTVTDNGGATDTESQTVVVTNTPPLNNPPNAGFSRIITGLTVAFTDTSTDTDGTIVSWAWNFGDAATSTAQNPSHTYASGGTYSVTLTATDNGGASNVATRNVTVASTGGSGSGRPFGPSNLFATNTTLYTQDVPANCFTYTQNSVSGNTALINRLNACASLQIWTTAAPVGGLHTQYLTGGCTISASSVPAGSGATVGAKSYDFVNPLTGTANQVLREATTAACIRNLRDAINRVPGTAGVKYSAATTQNPAGYAFTLLSHQLRIVDRNGGGHASDCPFVAVGALMNATVSAQSLAFDFSKWATRMDGYNTTAVVNAVQDSLSAGWLKGFFLQDEPQHPSWGGIMAKPLLDDMATYTKNIFGSNLPCGAEVRWDHRPSDPPYQVWDFVMSQYAFRFGDVTAWKNAVLATAASGHSNDGARIVFSMNILGGGPGIVDCPQPETGGRGAEYKPQFPRCLMTGQQIEDVGGVLGPAGRGLMMWSWLPNTFQSYYHRTEIQNAFINVGNVMSGLSNLTWHR